MPRPESNRYDRYQSQDFKPSALPVPPPRPPQANDGIRTRNPHLGKGGVLPLNYSHRFLYKKKCRLHDSGTRTLDCKSDALPTELSRLIYSSMRVKGLEPPRRKAPDPKSGASANSAKTRKNMTRTGLEPVTH